jgi:hypothetical protein
MRMRIVQPMVIAALGIAVFSFEAWATPALKGKCNPACENIQALINACNGKSPCDGSGTPTMSVAQPGSCDMTQLDPTTKPCNTDCQTVVTINDYTCNWTMHPLAGGPDQPTYYYDCFPNLWNAGNNANGQATASSQTVQISTCCYH